jgi:hypothetical protein
MLGESHDIDWAALAGEIQADMLARLQADESDMTAITARYQSCHACRTLVTFSVIARILELNQGTVNADWMHWNQTRETGDDGLVSRE